MHLLPPVRVDASLVNVCYLTKLSHLTLISQANVIQPLAVHPLVKSPNN